MLSLRFIPATLITAVLALALHLGLGWPWVLLAGAVGGYLAGALAGGFGVGLGWLGLLLWNHLAHADAVGRMTDALGGLMGGLPAWAVPAMSLLLGFLLGFLGGGIGRLLRGLLARGGGPARSGVTASPSRTGSR